MPKNVCKGRKLHLNKYQVSKYVSYRKTYLNNHWKKTLEAPRIRNWRSKLNERRILGKSTFKRFIFTNCLCIKLHKWAARMSLGIQEGIYNIHYTFVCYHALDCTFGFVGCVLVFSSIITIVFFFFVDINLAIGNNLVEFSECLLWSHHVQMHHHYTYIDLIKHFLHCIVQSCYVIFVFVVVMFLFFIFFFVFCVFQVELSIQYSSKYLKKKKLYIHLCMYVYVYALM